MAIYAASDIVVYNGIITEWVIAELFVSVKICDRIRHATEGEKRIYFDRKW